MLLPADSNPLRAEGWAVIVTYEGGGYVSDDDAEKINYTDLLREMQEATREDSAERVKQGYESLELLGWARQPHYDKKEKKLYWAKRLRFGSSTDETLNYDIRILGRKGVLSLNAVADMDSLARIDGATPDLLSMVSFNEGNLYSQFNPSVDEAAAYGVAGLIAGGLLTKAGFFKGLLVLLLASKKTGGCRSLRHNRWSMGAASKQCSGKRFHLDAFVARARYWLFRPTFHRLFCQIY